MGIASYSKSAVVNFVPEYGDNRKDTDPTVVGISFVNFGEEREFQRLIAAKARGAETQEQVMEVSQGLQLDQFLKHITYVKNYTVDGSEVTDIEEFYLSAPSDLTAEILAAMKDAYALTKGQAENFKRASDGASS